MSELPTWAADAVYVNKEYHFSFRDRLKLLVGYRMHTHDGVATENLAGRTELTVERISFGRPRWWPWQPSPYGAVEVRVAEVEPAQERPSVRDEG